VLLGAMLSVEHSKASATVPPPVMGEVESGGAGGNEDSAKGKQ
jgi:hypothetical protein